MMSEPRETSVLHRFGAHAALGLLAVILRGAYVLAIRDAPDFAAPELDPAFNLEAARAVAAGEGLGQLPFFRAPLYGWVLALLLKLGGGSLLAVRLFQVLFGAATTILTSVLGARVFGLREGLLAGLLVATNVVLGYFDGEFLITTLVVPLQVLALLLLVRAQGGRSVLAAGAVFGLASIARPNVLLCALPLGLWVAWRAARAADPGEGGGGRRRGRGLALFGLFALGWALPVAPITALNVFGGGDLVLVSSQGGLNLWVGNHPGADGTAAVLPGARRDLAGMLLDAEAMAEAEVGRELRPSEVSRHYAGKAFGALQGNPGRALRLFVWKTRLFLSDWEIGNNRHIRFFVRRHARLWWDFTPGFAWLLALAVLGLMRTKSELGRGRAERAPLLIFFAFYGASVVLFFVCSRFRAPVLPVLCIFAARGLVALFDDVRSKRVRAALPALALAALCLFASKNLPTGEPGGFFQLGRLDVSDASGWVQEGLFARRDGRPEEAEGHFRHALELRPRDPYAALELAVTLKGTGRLDEAAESLGAARASAPGNTRVLDELVDVELRRGRVEAAVQYSTELVAAAPAWPQAHYARGRALWAARDSAGAESAFRAGLALGPDFNCALGLGSLLFELGRMGAASEALEQAVATESAPRGFWFVAAERLCAALASDGRPEEARARARTLSQRFPGAPESRLLVERY